MGLEQLQELSLKGFMAQAEGLRLYELARAASRLGPCLETSAFSTMPGALTLSATLPCIAGVRYNRSSGQGYAK